MDAAYAEGYERLYHEHWWWRSRETILLGEIRRLGLASPLRILDVGCGNGLFFPKLSELGEVWGIEADTSVLHEDGPYRDRIFTELLGAPIYQDRRFDLITALDVIEHIEDDTAAVRDMAGMLAPGGVLLLTVPAFMLLWDEHDVINQHHRRYTRESLRRVLERHGEILSLRYMFHAIFFPKLLVKWLNRSRDRKIAQHNIPSPLVNKVMEGVNAAEFRLGRGLPIPFGTSVCGVLRRPSTASD